MKCYRALWGNFTEEEEVVPFCRAYKINILILIENDTIEKLSLS